MAHGKAESMAGEVFNPYEAGLKRWLPNEAVFADLVTEKGNMLQASPLYRKMLRDSKGTGEQPSPSTNELKDRERLLHLRLFHAGRMLGRLERKVAADLRRKNHARKAA